MTATEIVNLLADKHSEDVFVAECKTGPSQGHRHGRLDAWAAKKSWAHPCVYGYEVKVSRADFLRDDKWTYYLDYCNQFHFVCPSKLISVDELPPEAGLMYVSSNASRLITKKKAPHRQVEIPAGLLWYILYSRAKIDVEYSGSNRETHLREWLRKKNDNHELGYLVSEKIRKIVRAIKDENRRLGDENRTFNDIRTMLVEMNIDPGSWGVHGKARNALTGIHPDLVRSLKELKGRVDESINELERLAKGN
jgi:hypothetical protein